MTSPAAKLSAKDQKALEEIFLIFRALETAHLKSATWNVESLGQLKSKLSALENSDNPWVVKLSLIENHLHPQMSPKHLVTFLVPVERLLQKNIQDDDFLVSETDHAVKSDSRLPLHFVLHNLRSAFNVGSIFRTAECLNAEKIHLCGYTPTPANSKVLKTALGTESFVAWEAKEKILEALQALKAQGFYTVALETAQKSKDLYESFSDEDYKAVAFVVGNERFGLDHDVLQAVDEVRRIPLRGRKNSLNVGVAVAVAGFEWVRQAAPWNLE